MSVSKEEYRRILSDQKVGRLTIFIDTSAFRQLFTQPRLDLTKLATAVGRPLRSEALLIRTLSHIDSLSPVLSSGLSFLAFGWWGLAGTIGSFGIWSAYKRWASRGRQRVLPVTLVLAAAVVLGALLPLPNVWARAFVWSLGAILFVGRTLYVTTAKIVFTLIHSSYPFFDMFYLQPEGAEIPLIWTSEWSDAQLARHGR